MPKVDCEVVCPGRTPIRCRFGVPIENERIGEVRAKVGMKLAVTMGHPECLSDRSMHTLTSALQDHSLNYEVVNEARDFSFLGGGGHRSSRMDAHHRER